MEKALRKLLAVAEDAREELSDRYDGAPDGGCQWMSTLIIDLDQAIAQSKKALSE